MNTVIETKQGRVALKKFYTPAEVSEILDVPEGRLSIWRITGKPALAFHKFGKSVRYSVKEVEAFIRRTEQEHTGDAA
jgi:hypothetical protein